MSHLPNLRPPQDEGALTSISTIITAVVNTSRTPNFSHNLGTNAGGLFKGVYLSRTRDLVNKDTGEPFKARDFYVGTVAKLPSVSLEVWKQNKLTLAPKQAPG